MADSSLDLLFFIRRCVSRPPSRKGDVLVVYVSGNSPRWGTGLSCGLQVPCTESVVRESNHRVDRGKTRDFGGRGRSDEGEWESLLLPTSTVNGRCPTWTYIKEGAQLTVFHPLPSLLCFISKFQTDKERNYGRGLVVPPPGHRLLPTGFSRSSRVI